MSIAQRILLNGLKEEIRIRNADRAAMHNLLTNVLHVSDVATIATAYNFGDRTVVPEELADALCEYGEITIAYKKMTARVYLDLCDNHDIPIYIIDGILPRSRFLHWEELLELMLTGYNYHLHIMLARSCSKELSKDEALAAVDQTLSGIYDGIYARIAQPADSAPI